MSVTSLVQTDRERYQIGLVLLVGLFFGTIGGAINQLGLALVGTAVLVSLLGAYSHTLQQKNGMLGGMVAGGILGLLVTIIGLPMSHNIGGIADGALFGLMSGLLIGGIIGIITHARSDEGDNLFTKIFLVIGSIAIGAFLGAGVGVISGAILGLIYNSWQGALMAALAGGIVGGYIGTYFQKIQAVIIGAFSLALVAALSSLVNGALAGLVLGLISGTFAPMLLVALIGAYGGLLSRGLKAMVVEAAEAPAEMLRQGAVPFLVPAMMVGMMVGTAASGVGGLIVLPVSLAIVGLMLAVFGDLEGKPDNQVNIRTIVEMTMMGAEEWPIRRVISHITVKNRKKAAVGAIFSLLVGMVGCSAGIFLGQWLSLYLQTILGVG
jgi:hypothetical protein